MTTIVDALIVTLGLDPKSFEKGADQANKAQEKLEKNTKSSNKRMSEEEKKLDDERKRREKAIEDRAKAITSALQKARNEALAFFSALAIGSGLKSFIENTITSASNLGMLSDNLGMSTENLGAWQRAAERAGGSVEGMTSQLKQSADDVAKFKMGMSSDSLQWFFREGGSTDSLKDGNTYLLARADIIKKIFDVDPNRARVIAQSMGIGEDSFNLIKRGSAAVLDLVSAQEKLSKISREDSQSALALNNSWLDFKESIGTTAEKLLLKMAPAIERLLTWLNKLGDWISNNKDEIAKWADETLAKALPILENLIKKLENANWQEIGDDLKAVGRAFLAIADAINSALDAWDRWNGKDKVATSGVSKGWGGFRFGKHDDIAEDDIRNGRIPEAGRISGGKIRRPGESNANSASTFAALEKKYGLPPGLLDSVWNAESGRGSRMRSSKGAMGHFMFMPGTAKQYGLKDPDNLSESADAAARMYRDLLKQNGGDLPRALAGYNWGQGKMQQQGFGNAPQETRDYIDRVIGGISRSNALASASLPSRASARSAPGSSQSGSVSSETHIDTINIQTAATDAAGIAKSIGPAIQRYSFASQANTGLN